MTLMTAHIVAILTGYVLGLGALLTMVVVILITDYIAVGTVAMLVVMIIYTAVFHPGVMTLVAVIGLTVMSLYKHWMNYVRIRNGTEKKVRSVLFAKKS